MGDRPHEHVHLGYGLFDRLADVIALGLGIGVDTLESGLDGRGEGRWGLNRQGDDAGKGDRRGENHGLAHGVTPETLGEGPKARGRGKDRRPEGTARLGNGEGEAFQSRHFTSLRARRPVVETGGQGDHARRAVAAAFSRNRAR